MKELTKDPGYVYLMAEGEHVLVNGVECVVGAIAAQPQDFERALIYLTTADSDLAAYEVEVKRLQKEARDSGEMEFVVDMVPDLIYSDYIKNLRPGENGSAGMTRDEMVALIKSGQFVLA